MGAVLIDRLRRAQRLAHATGELVGIMCAPGAVLLAWAWGRRNKEWML